MANEIVLVDAKVLIHDLEPHYGKFWELDLKVKSLIPDWIEA